MKEGVIILYHIQKRTQDFYTRPLKGLSPLPHIHSHLELIYLTEGCSIATYGTQQFLLEKGDLFLAFPNQIHYYHDQVPPAGYLVIFSPDLYGELKELFYSQIPISPVIKSHQLSTDAKDILVKLYAKIGSDLSFDQIVAKGCLLSLIGYILPSMDFLPSNSDQDSVKELLKYCSTHYTEPLTLDSVSKALYLNKYYISHIFKERMNLSFTDFINRMRTEHACNLLKMGANITEVAFASGFSSIRNFNRVFALNMGMTPREYMQRKE